MQWLRDYRNILQFIPLAALLTISLVILRSIDQQTSIEINLIQQVMAICIGIFFGSVLHSIGERGLRASSPWLYGASVALLVATALFGVVLQGSQRWVEIAGLQFQPSEIAKAGLIFMVAYILSMKAVKKAGVLSVRTVWLLLSLALVFALTAAQPDLGTAVSFAVVWVCMLLASTSHRALALGVVVLGLVSSPLVFSNLETYQQERITSFLDSGDGQSSAAGYNVDQARIAIENGGWFGQGLDAGTQSQLEFLPSQHTDFIFAVIVEKIGFIGGAIVLCSFVALVVRQLLMTRRYNSDFMQFLSIGFIGLIAFASIYNIAMNLGLVPVTGIPLPFMSYGGTHTVIEVALFVLLARASTVKSSLQR